MGKPTTRNALLGALAIALASNLIGANASAQTPTRVEIRGFVFGPSPGSSVSVSAADGSGTFVVGGPFSFFITFPGFPFVVTATIDGVPVRTIATFMLPDLTIPVIIHPAYEAGVELLEEIGLDRFTPSGIAAVLGAVLTANSATDFGLDIRQTIATAREVAAASSDVQHVIDESILRLCVGDCDGGGTVTVDELVTGVNIALGRRPIADCRAIAQDNVVDVSFLVRAILNALDGCALPS